MKDQYFWNWNHIGDVYFNFDRSTLEISDNATTTCFLTRLSVSEFLTPEERSAQKFSHKIVNQAIVEASRVLEDQTNFLTLVDQSKKLYIQQSNYTLRSNSIPSQKASSFNFCEGTQTNQELLTMQELGLPVSFGRNQLLDDQKPNDEHMKQMTTGSLSSDSESSLDIASCSSVLRCSAINESKFHDTFETPPTFDDQHDVTLDFQELPSVEKQKSSKSIVSEDQKRAQKLRKSFCKVRKTLNDFGFYLGTSQPDSIGKTFWSCDAELYKQPTKLDKRLKYFGRIQELSQASKELLNSDPINTTCCSYSNDLSTSDCAIQPNDLAADLAKSTTRKRKAFDCDFSFNPGFDDHLIARMSNIKSDKRMRKYWKQRYSLFTLFDNDVLMDQEGWFSVTPEHIAEHIAQRTRCDIIVDAFCGVGGNAIQFAKVCELVIAVDIDPVKIKCARRNAEIYGVADRIQFLCADFMHVSQFLKADVVFLSPAWGGPEYVSETVFDLDTIKPNGRDIFYAARRISPNIVYFLPKNTGISQLSQLAEVGSHVEVEQSLMFNRLKSLTAYFGDYFIWSNTDSE